MKKYRPSKPLIFIHIPKTAGHSVREIVKTWFGNDFHTHYYNEKNGIEPTILADKVLYGQRPAPVIYGHFNSERGFGVQEQYPKVEQFVSILRDPFEMAVSNYFFIRKVGARWHTVPLSIRLDLEDYLMKTKPNMLNHFPRTVTMSNFKDIIEEFFIEIGLAERLRESLRRISVKIGRGAEIGEIPYKNRTDRDDFEYEPLRAAYQEQNVLEFEVYNYVRANFD